MYIKGRRRPAGVIPQHVPPLSQEAWEDFVEALKRGPTPEQVRAMERAMDLTLHMVQSRDEDRGDHPARSSTALR